MSVSVNSFYRFTVNLLLRTIVFEDLQIGYKEDKDEVSTESGNGNEERVDCPVCGKKVRGEELVINSHLGIIEFFLILMLIFKLFFEHFRIISSIFSLIVE